MTKTATVHAIQKWEYQFLTKKTEAYLVKELNELGQIGWELVAAGQGKDRAGELSWTAFLKRPYVPHPTRPVEEGAADQVVEPGGTVAAAAPPIQGFDLDGEEFSLQQSAPAKEEKAE